MTPAKETNYLSAMYRDEGCDLHNECLSCPLPRCRYDTEKAPDPNVRMRRWKRIYEMHLAGATYHQIVKEMAVSQRTVFRAIDARGVMAPPAPEKRLQEQDKPGKPVSQIRQFIKARRPLPVMQENMR